MRWQVPTGAVVSAPAVANGVTYATSRTGTLYAFDRYGDVLDTTVAGWAFFGSRAISDGVVYLSTYSGSTSAFAELAGVNAATRRPAAPAPGSPHPDLGLTVTR